MNGFLAIFDREIRAYFLSPMAWVILAFFLFGNGYTFSIIVSYLADPRAGGVASPLQVFFGSFFYWLVLLFITPVLTMRLLSEERRSGTLETLMTAPVTETQVVLAKYAAALCFYVFLWLPTLSYVAIIARGDVDWGPIASGYLGIFGMGAMFLSVGLFASSFTKNQLVASVMTFALLMVLFTAGFLDGLTTDDTWKSLLGHMNLLDHMDAFGRGIVDTRHLIYYASTSALFLFLTVRSLEAKKWR